MSAAAPQYEQRGGLLQRAHHASSTTNTNMMTAVSALGHAVSQSHHIPSAATSITEHDFRFPRRPTHQKPIDAAQRRAPAPPTGGRMHMHPQIPATGRPDDGELGNLDFAVEESSARKDLLRDSFFPTWRDDSVDEELDNPDQMQKKDPLATQIWRLYTKTKKQLPNQERMENLTWRMMAMSLRKRKQEEAARYVCVWWFARISSSPGDTCSNQPFLCCTDYLLLRTPPNPVP
jgi:GATA-binding protein